MTLFESAVRPVLFRLGGGDAETAHEFTLARLARLGGPSRALLRARYATRAPVEVFGVRFPNPIGLAAGMDKNGVALPAWPALGFGFVEVGTVTAQGQPGNDKPRLFRLPESEAIINRMGFNNAGAGALAARLDALGPLGVPLGISLGKSKVTPLEDAVQDYLTSYTLLHPYADYIAVNVSSPNTPGLRVRGHRAGLDEAEAERRPRGQRDAVLVHARGQADRVGEPDPEDLDRGVGGEPGLEHRAWDGAEPGQPLERELVRGLGVAAAQPEQDRPDG